MEIQITKDELYTMIKNAVREVISEKEIHHILHYLPEVSDAEMKEINETYGQPDQYSDVAFSEKLDI